MSRWGFIMADHHHVVDDIEDVVSPGKDESKYSNKVLPKSFRKRGRAVEEARGDSFIPGAHSVYLKTWGCTHNTSDGEYMAGLLAAKGYAIIDSPLDANVWLLNSCTVKGPSEDSFHEAVKRGHKLGKKIVAAGCVPQGQKDLPDLKDVSVIGVQQIDRVVEVMEEALQGNRVTLFGQQREGRRRLAGPSLDLPKIRRNPLIEIIPINSGCLNHCTYCKTKHSRGDLASYYPEEIIERAQQAFNEGVVELWLTSEDTGAYGRDIDVTLPDLLWRLVRIIPDDCMMRIGMTNPPYIMEYLEDIAEILKHPRVYSFLHVPVQSGSDPVLSEMKREYTVSQFKQLVDFLTINVPGITIVTDIICGFPTELEEDFQETLQLVEKYKFPSLFINQFYPRPGTPAAKMKRLPNNEVKNRSRRLTKLFRSYASYDHLVGSIQTVLVTERSHDSQYYVGHTKCYEQVLVEPVPELMGKLVKVTITSAGKHHLMGVVMDSSTQSTVELHKRQQQRGCSNNNKKQLMSSFVNSVYSTDVLLILLLLFALLILSVYKFELHQTFVRTLLFVT